MRKKTLKQAVHQFKAKPGRTAASKGTPEQPLWTRPDVFFGDQFTSVLGAVELPVSGAGARTTGQGSKRQRQRVKPRAEGGHYTVREVADKLGISADLVRELFRNEPGVIRLNDENAGKKRKRGYVTL